MINEHLVKVIIPLYSEQLSDLEIRSLNQVYTVLKNYPIVVVKPVSLNISSLSQRYPNLLFESFDDRYFENISGYNKLMLSNEFYMRFIYTGYLLIYQLDAFVFRDELEYWCSKGYDYIGAPWLKAPIDSWPIFSTINDLNYFYYDNLNQRSKQSLYNKVGNGGFSLRKVESFFDASSLYEYDIIDFLKEKRSHLFNEDVYWATEVRGFSYPKVPEALRFSFDKYPKHCYKLAGKQLPFGCHGWYKRKMKRFWKPIIGF